MFAKNDEEKRNRLWKTAISVSTLVYYSDRSILCDKIIYIESSGRNVGTGGQ